MRNEKINKIKSAIEGLTKEELTKLTANFQKNAAPVKTALEDLEQTAQKEIFNDSKKERRKNFILLATGAIFGGALTLVWYFFRDEIASKYQYVTAIWVVVLLVIAILLGILLFFKDTLLYKVFGVGKASYEAIIGTMASPVKNIIKGLTKKKVYRELEPSLQVVENSSRQLIAYLAYRRTRTWLFGLFFTLIIGLFGFLGTFLLVRQNELIKEQSYLSEAARRSSLVFMMSNIMDKVDEELSREGVSNEPYHESRKLSDVTIGRISALCQGMKPIKYLYNGELTDEAYSPERGQLLLSLANSKLDTSETYRKIMERTLFDKAELQNVIIDDIILDNVQLNGALLNGASLKRTSLRNISIDNANLEGADLSNSNLEGNEFNLVNFNEASFEESSLRNCAFMGSKLKKMNCKNADFKGVVFNFLLGKESINEYLEDLRDEDFEDVLAIKEGLFRFEYHTMNISGNFRFANFDNSYIFHSDFTNTDAYDSSIDWLYKSTLEGSSFRHSLILHSAFKNSNFGIDSFIRDYPSPSTYENMLIEKNEYGFSRESIRNLGSYDSLTFKIPLDFPSADLDNARIFHSNLSSSRFEYAKIRNVRFFYSNLSEVEFYRCDLSNSDLRGVNIKNATFEQTILDNVIVENSDWVEQLEELNVVGREYIEEFYYLKEEKREYNTMDFDKHITAIETYYILKRKNQTNE